MCERSTNANPTILFFSFNCFVIQTCTHIYSHIYAYVHLPTYTVDLAVHTVGNICRSVCAEQDLCILPNIKLLLLNWAAVGWYLVSSLVLDLVWGLEKGFLVVQVSDVASRLHMLWQVHSPLEHSSPLYVCILPDYRDKSLPPLKWPTV